jgi:hypothetical protein
MMRDQQRFFRIFLRGVGSVSLLAVFAVIMPYTWMNAIHKSLGLGVLPNAPIVGYLARSTSAFYALLGGLLWVLSFDLVRYQPILRYLGFAMVVFGLVLLGVDWIEGMPVFWIVGEGPVVVCFGLVILWFCHRFSGTEDAR